MPTQESSNKKTIMKANENIFVFFLSGRFLCFFLYIFFSQFWFVKMKRKITRFINTAMPDATMQINTAMPDATKSVEEISEAASLPTRMEKLSVSFETSLSANSAMTSNSTRFSFVKTKNVEKNYGKSCKLKTNGLFKHNLHVHCTKKYLIQKTKYRRFVQPSLDLCNMPPLSLAVDLDKIDGICKIEYGNNLKKMQI